MEKITNYLNRFIDIMEQPIRGVHITCYSVALVGLTIAVRKVRPFSRFRRPSDIPNHFIREKRPLTGFVERIEPSGALLMIRHKPLLELPFIRNGELPVKISGVNVSGLGISWLQTIVAGNEVQFVPVLKDKDALHCEVVLQQATRSNKVRIVNLGESLISIGFGSIIDNTLKTDDKYWADYYKKLKKAEVYALRKKLGIKYYISPTRQVLTLFGKKVEDLIRKAAKTKTTTAVAKVSTA